MEVRRDSKSISSVSTSLSSIELNNRDSSSKLQMQCFLRVDLPKEIARSLQLKLNQVRVANLIMSSSQAKGWRILANTHLLLQVQITRIQLILDIPMMDKPPRSDQQEPKLSDQASTFLSPEAESQWCTNHSSNNK